MKMLSNRKHYSGRNVERALSIDELRTMARRRTPSFAFEYVEGGAEDEAALHGNRAALAALRFVPNTLVNTAARQQRTMLFGRELRSPFLIAPTGLNGMLRRDGDAMLARAAAAHGAPFTLSTVSNIRLEQLATTVNGRLWMQLYVLKDRNSAQDILARAERAGYEALVFTTDANVFGNREWDRRSYRAPGQLTLRKSLDVALHPRWAYDVLLPHAPRFENILDYLPPEGRSARTGVIAVPRLFAPDISWSDVEWLRQAWPRKLLIKGVLTVADATRAADAGCDGVIVSNHGGRQLDHCIAPIEALPHIARAVGERMTIIVDGGFRRGGDIVKAIALGAHAVMLGRAALYGLAAGGEAGVRRALDILTSEIDRVLGQLGCNSLADLGPHLLRGMRDDASK